MGRKRKKPVTFWLSENELSSLNDRGGVTGIEASYRLYYELWQEVITKEFKGLVYTVKEIP